VFDESSFLKSNITGSSKEPSFEEDQITVLLSDVSTCSSLEITTVSENIDARLIICNEGE
jgi:hypothetical protein